MRTFQVRYYRANDELVPVGDIFFRPDDPDYSRVSLMFNTVDNLTHSLISAVRIYFVDGSYAEYSEVKS